MDCIDFRRTIGRPRMGAWIEIQAQVWYKTDHDRRPRMGAWIEMGRTTRQKVYMMSPPYGGVD